MSKYVEDAVLNALKYYAIFHYPLTAEEIHGNCNAYCSLQAVKDSLDELHSNNLVYKYNDFYSLKSDVKELTLRRKEGNMLALIKEPKARKVGSFIYKFPFVRFVGISGSLSKGYADNKSDYDFFIITEKNRLWICRTILHIFKKATFLVGQQHKFCMNYFIDKHKLELEEKNQFTAVELASLIPVKGEIIYTAFLDSNKWANDFFPNGYYRFTEPATVTDSKSIIKKATEFVLNLFFVERANQMLMRLTDIKWRKKWSKKNYPMEEYDLAFKTTLHISKNHHRNHQKKVLSRISNIQPLK